ncbi:MAG: PHB depolymerase family esterase [Planctomycetota bacterium]|nr:PHB depolymerase family esterase [Planctomycetota bacterium]
MKLLVATVVSGLAVPMVAHAQNITFPHDGLDREYLIHVPNELPESASLVLVLHGYGMNNSQLEKCCGWPDLADERGFVVAFPNGSLDKSNKHFWDVDYPIHQEIEIDDDGFLRELAFHLQDLYGINPDKVFVTGFSNGGDMSYQLACRESETFMAFAPVTGTMMDSLFTNCDPAVPHPILAMNGTSDNVVLYNGDMDNATGWGPYRSVPEIIAFWAKVLETTDMDQTNLPDVNPNDGSTVRLDIYSSLQNDLELWFYAVIGGGHEWPGAWGNMDINASVEISNFFERNSEAPCIGDVDGSGEVSVNDLLLVLGEYSSCTGECSGDLDGDGDVDVEDVLAVIELWGTTCEFSGACCLTDGSCQYIESVECETVGGEWNGSLSSCLTSSCSNSAYDECHNAMPVINGQTVFSTLDATTSTDVFDDELCQGAWLGGVYNDIWFTYEATCSGLLTLSTCNSATFDTDLVLYKGNCLNKVQVACNGDGNNCSGYTSLLETEVTSGTSYLIRLGGWGGGSSGTGTLSISCEE